MSNQHKTIPRDELDPLVKQLFDDGKSDVQIVKWILGTPEYHGLTLSTKSIQRSRQRQGLKNSWNAKHTPATVAPLFEKLRSEFPTMGAGRMKAILQTQDGIRVPQKMLLEHMRNVEPEATAARKSSRLHRRRQYIAGVNVTWSMDQHDKWQSYGLRLHAGLDICSGYILWARVWWNNRNPNLIASYYLDAIDIAHGIPLLTQSDGGTENFNIAKAQTAMRQILDPSLVGSIQHRWMGARFNTPPETFWSGLRLTWTRGYEDLFELGVAQQWYDLSNALHRMLFRWLAVPWLQEQLDRFIRTLNLTKKRRDKNKVLPQGRAPQDIFLRPEDSDVLDFKVDVDQATLDTIRQRYADPEHPVFQLTPPDFDVALHALMDGLGNPTITRESFWDIYNNLLQQLLMGDPAIQHNVVERIQADDQMQDADREEANQEHREALGRLAPKMNVGRVPGLVVNGHGHGVGEEQGGGAVEEDGNSTHDGDDSDDDDSDDDDGLIGNEAFADEIDRKSVV